MTAPDRLAQTLNGYCFLGFDCFCHGNLLVVVCVAIALYMRLRRHLQAAHAAREGSSSEAEHERKSGDIEH